MTRADSWLIDVRPERRIKDEDRQSFAAAAEAALACGLTFGELAVSGPYEPLARAQLLHLLWRRRLGVDLFRPLGDGSAVRLADGVLR